MGRILITGITGQVGGALARYFLEEGCEVFGTVRTLPAKALLSSDGEGKRRTSPLLQTDRLPQKNQLSQKNRLSKKNQRPQTNQLPLDDDHIIAMDLAKPGMPPLPLNLDAVIHCAAATSENPVRPAMSRLINVAGTERLIDACRQAGVRRFLYISTMSAYPQNPSLYAQTKLEAEAIVRGITDMEYCILRPGLIISTISRGIFNKMRNYVLKLPLIPIIGNNDGLATISIQDLCRAVARAAQVSKAAGEDMDLCADESLSIQDIVKAIAAMENQRVLCVPIPYTAALGIAQIAAWLKLPLLTKDNVYGLKYARKADASKLERLLDMKIRTLPETIREMAERG